MRNDFVRQLMVEMERDENIYLLTGDLGFRAFEPVKERFPNRFVNAGVAEANMMGVAAGMALTGKKVVAYSIASFATMRCFEQIRSDICYHNLDVKIVGVGGGVNYAHQGVTHHTVEDLALMRVLPNMRVICPSYSWEAREATRVAIQDKGPVYLRFGKSPNGDYSQQDFDFKFGKGFVIKEGSDVALICTGNMLDITLAAAELIQQRIHKSVCVVSMPCIKPLDTEMIKGLSQRVEAIITIEEHSVIGGLGCAVGDVLLSCRLTKCIFEPIGFKDTFVHEVGCRDYLLACVGLDAEGITRRVVEVCKDSGASL